MTASMRDSQYAQRQYDNHYVRQPAYPTAICLTAICVGMCSQCVRQAVSPSMLDTSCMPTHNIAREPLEPIVHKTKRHGRLIRAHDVPLALVSVESLAPFTAS